MILRGTRSILGPRRDTVTLIEFEDIQNTLLIKSGELVPLFSYLDLPCRAPAILTREGNPTRQCHGRHDQLATRVNKRNQWLTRAGMSRRSRRRSLHWTDPGVLTVVYADQNDWVAAYSQKHDTLDRWLSSSVDRHKPSSITVSGEMTGRNTLGV